MATPNAELAYKVLDHIDANPEQHNQQRWYEATDCGTVACFAGWTVLLAGHQVIPDEPGDDGFTGYAAIDGIPSARMAVVAAQDLGISGLEVPCPYHDDAGEAARCAERPSASAALFAGGNSRENLGDLVLEIFGPRPGGEPS